MLLLRVRSLDLEKKQKLLNRISAWCCRSLQQQLVYIWRRVNPANAPRCAGCLEGRCQRQVRCCVEPLQQYSGCFFDANRRENCPKKTQTLQYLFLCYCSSCVRDLLLYMAQIDPFCVLFLYQHTLLYNSRIYPHLYASSIDVPPMPGAVVMQSRPSSRALTPCFLIADSFSLWLLLFALLSGALVVHATPTAHSHLRRFAAIMRVPSKQRTSRCQRCVIAA